MESFTPEQIEKYSRIYRSFNDYKSLNTTEQVLTAYCDLVSRVCGITRDDYLYYTKVFEQPNDDITEGYKVGKVKMAQDLFNTLSLKYIDLNNKSINYSSADLTRTLRILGKCDLQFQDVMPKVICFNSLRLGLDPEITSFTNDQTLIVKNMKPTKPVDENTIMKSIDFKTTERVK